MRRAALVAGLAVIVLGCGQAPPSGGTAPTPMPVPSSSATVTPSSTPTAVPTSEPTTTPSPTPAPAACATTTGGDAAASSAIVDVRVGAHPGYDRFVIEFAGSVPAWSVAPQANTTFTLSPKGSTVTLAGSSGLLVRVEHVADWTGYAGPTAFAPGYPALREARLVENFEGVTQWGLGVTSSGCANAYQLTGPGRLVVDVPA